MIMNEEGAINVEIKEFDDGAKVKDIPNAVPIKKLADNVHEKKKQSK
jgi:hypothetical protein